MNAENEQLADSAEPIQRKHSLFADPAISKGMEDDPLVRLISAKWKGVLTFCLILAAGFYLKGQMHETSMARVKESSQVFDQARQALESLSNNPSISAEEKQKMQLSLTDSLANLKSGAEPYAELSALYAAIASSQSAASQPVAAEIAWKQEKDPSARLIKELQALVTLRGKVDSEGSAAVSQDLKDLIREGSYADLSAFMMLARIAESAEDKQFVKDNAAEMKSRYADKSDKIDSVITE